jgi:O-methyltransferase
VNNAFLTELFDWGRRDRKGIIGIFNAFLRRLKIPWVISRALDPTRDMTNLLQRHNLWHLAMQPLVANVPGDFVDLGCFDGKTSVIFARTLLTLAPDRELHVYDHFAMGFHLTGQNIQTQLSENFHRAGVPQPLIHAGDFRETIPRQLPETIAFAHIDCGYGGDAQAHRALLGYLLSHLYPRMATGSICILADFHDSQVSRSPNYNPGVSLAVQDFFADKPETVSVLLADDYTHGYVRKE